jgi:hypothetical protein
MNNHFIVDSSVDSFQRNKNFIGSFSHEEIASNPNLQQQLYNSTFYSNGLFKFHSISNSKIKAFYIYDGEKIFENISTSGKIDFFSYRNVSIARKKREFQKWEKVLNPKYFSTLKEEFDENLKGLKLEEEQELKSADPEKIFDIQIRYRKIREDEEAKFVFASLRNGFITDKLGLFFNLDTQTYGMVNLHVESENKIQSFKSEAVAKKVIVDKYLNVDEKRINLKYVPNIRVKFNPKNSFGIIPFSEEKTGFHRFTARRPLALAMGRKCLFLS